MEPNAWAEFSKYGLEGLLILVIIGAAWILLRHQFKTTERREADIEWYRNHAETIRVTLTKSLVDERVQHLQAIDVQRTSFVGVLEDLVERLEDIAKNLEVFRQDVRREMDRVRDDLARNRDPFRNGGK